MTSSEGPKRQTHGRILFHLEGRNTQSKDCVFFIGARAGTGGAPVATGSGRIPGAALQPCPREAPIRLGKLEGQE